jgi:hypothetical protein
MGLCFTVPFRLHCDDVITEQKDVYHTPQTTNDIKDFPCFCFSSLFGKQISNYN